MLIGIVFVVALLLAVISLALPDRLAIGTITIAAVCLAAVLTTIEAGRAGRYVWAMGLLGLAAILHPILRLVLSPAGAALLLSVGLVVLAGWMILWRRTVPPRRLRRGSL
jgi:hypothetical protein